MHMYKHRYYTKYSWWERERSLAKTKCFIVQWTVLHIEICTDHVYILMFISVRHSRLWKKKASKISPGYGNLSLKELLSAAWGGRCSLTRMVASVLLLLTVSIESRGYPSIELAFLIKLFSFFLSPAELLLPQQTYTTRDGWCYHRVIGAIPALQNTQVSVGDTDCFCRWHLC